MQMLSNYITRMAINYYDIGLELKVDNDKLRIIQCDLRFPNFEEKCREMLNLWLENDISATWGKLCEVLERKNQSVLARDIREMIHSK